MASFIHGGGKGLQETIPFEKHDPLMRLVVQNTANKNPPRTARAAQSQ